MSGIGAMNWRRSGSRSGQNKARMKEKDLVDDENYNTVTILRESKNINVNLKKDII